MEPSHPQPLDYASRKVKPALPPLEPMARNALIAGALFFLTPLPCLLAIFFGILGIDRTRREGKRGQAHAWVGLLLGLLGVGVWIGGYWLKRNLDAQMRQVWVAMELRQLGQAMLLYANDNKGQLPDTLENMVVQSTPLEDFREVITSRALGDSPATGNTNDEIFAKILTGKHTSFIYLGQPPAPNYEPGKLYLRGFPSDPNLPLAYVTYMNGGRLRTSILFEDHHVDTFDHRRGMEIVRYGLAQRAKPTTVPGR